MTFLLGKGFRSCEGLEMTGIDSNLSHNKYCLTELQTARASDDPPLKMAPGGDNGGEGGEEGEEVSQSKPCIGSP